MATIEATITKVAHETGTEWYAIETDHSTIKKLSTKVKRAAEEAAALRIEGVPAEITYTQRDREANGRVYHNYYLDKAERAASNGTSGGGIDEVTPTGRKTDPGDAWRMCLAKGSELALRTLPLMPAEARDFDTQKRIALAWARFITETPPPGPEQKPAPNPTRPNPPSAPGAYEEPASYETAPPHTDDDIPFLERRPFLCLVARVKPSVLNAAVATA